MQRKEGKFSSNEDGKGCKIEFLTDTYCEGDIVSVKCTCAHVQAVLLYSVTKLSNEFVFLGATHVAGALLLQNQFFAAKLVWAISKIIYFGLILTSILFPLMSLKLSCIFAKSTINRK